MKSKLIVTFSVLAALAIGFFLGRFQTGRSWERFFLHYTYQRDSNETFQHVRVLTCLRDGRQADALSTLEILLDGSLITFSTYNQVVPPDKREDFVFRTVQVARDYRAKHPWHSTSTNVDEAVQSALNLTK